MIAQAATKPVAAKITTGRNKVNVSKRVVPAMALTKMVPMTPSTTTPITR